MGTTAAQFGYVSSQTVTTHIQSRSNVGSAFSAGIENEAPAVNANAASTSAAPPTSASASSGIEDYRRRLQMLTRGHP